MAWMLLLLFLGNVRGIDRATESSCDLLELNHAYDAKGCYVYSQVIAWRVMPEDGRFHTVGWRLVEKYETPITGSDGRWRSYGKSEGVIVRAPMMRTSWTQIDPDSTDRRKYWKAVQPPNVFDPPTRSSVLIMREQLRR